MEKQDKSNGRQGPIAWAMKNRQVVLALTFFLVAFGMLSLKHMPRQEFPDFVIRQGLVVGVYPGATSEEVEERLTDKVENYLFGFKEVKREKTYSISRRGYMYVFVELEDDVVNPEVFWSKVRLGLSEFKSQHLPAQVMALQAVTEFGDVTGVLLTLTSDGKSYKELGVEMDRLTTRLRQVDGVAKVNRYGEQSERLLVRLDKDRLAAYQLQPASVLVALKLDAGMTAAGFVHQGQMDIPIHLPPAYNSEKELADAVVFADPYSGGVVRLRDVAEIVRDHGRLDSYVEMDGQRALLVGLEMKQGYNIVAFGEEIEKAVEEFNASGDGRIQASRIVDQPGVVKASVDNFMNEFGMAIVAVVLVTLLLLPFRVAAVAAATIPVCILITLGIMQLMGMDLNTVTLASLILVLGMVVDNAIIVIDDHVERLDQGESLWNAALRSSATLLAPVFSATFAIVMVFVPMMLFMTGIGGDFVGGLPITVCIALLVSMAVSTFLVPILNMTFIRTGLHDASKEKKGFSILDFMQKVYDFGLDLAFRKPLWALALGVIAILAAFMVAWSLPQQLFPSLERNQFAVEIYLPEGRSLNETEAVAKSLAESLSQDPQVSRVASFIGCSSPRFHALYAPSMPASHFAQLLVTTTSAQETIEVLTRWQAKVLPYPDARVRFKEIAMSTSKSALEVRVVGDSLSAVHGVAEKILEMMRQQKDIVWTEYDFQEKVPIALVEMDHQAAAYAGVSRDVLGGALALATGRLTATTLWEGDVPVKVEFTGERHGDFAVGDLGNALVPSMVSQTLVPLRQLAQVKPGWSQGQIVHRDGVRTLTVRGDVRVGVLAKPIWLDIRREVEAMPLPSGVRLEYGGDEEGEKENYLPLAKALLLGVLSVFMILLFQFHSIPYTLLIMASMPLSLFGAVFGLMVTDYPFGFTAFIGIISLFGMVVRNGIILVRYAEELRSSGMPPQTAAMFAGKRRMRPIFLTSMAAAVGVVPMIASGSTLWGPLGAVICFGLIFSTVLTLLVLPVIYWKIAQHTKTPEANDE